MSDREEFEAMIKEIYSEKMLEKPTGYTELNGVKIDYVSSKTQRLWQRWQARQTEIDHLKQQLSEAQAKVDSLMLEYCPDDMSLAQVANWYKHQKPARRV